MKKITKHLLSSTLALTSIFAIGYSALNISNISNNVYSSVETDAIETYATQPSDAQKGIYTNSASGSTIQYNYYIETHNNGQTVDNSYLGLQLQGEIPTSVIDTQSTSQTAADDVVWYGVSLQGGTGTYSTEKLINFNTVTSNGSNNDGTTHYIGTNTGSTWEGTYLEFQGTTPILNFNTTSNDTLNTGNTNYINKELNTLEEDTQYTFRIYLDNNPFYDNTAINTVKSTTTMWFEFTFTTPSLEDAQAIGANDVAVITNNVSGTNGDSNITETEITRGTASVDNTNSNGSNDDIVALDFNAINNNNTPGNSNDDYLEYFSRNAKSKNDFRVVQGPTAGYYYAEVFVGGDSTDQANYGLTDIDLYVTGTMPSFVTPENPTFEWGLYVVNEDGTESVPANNERILDTGTGTAYEDQNGVMTWSNYENGNGTPLTVENLMPATNYTISVQVDETEITEDNLGTTWFQFNVTSGNTTLDNYSARGTVSDNGTWIDAILADPTSPWSIGLIVSVSLLIVTVIGLSVSLYALHHHYHKNRVNERLLNQHKEETTEMELRLLNKKEKSIVKKSQSKSNKGKK